MIDNYKTETDKIQETLAELNGNSISFQSTKCELCRQPLELPTIYFMCKHAYHTKCLGDLTHECPRCGPEHRLIEEMLKPQEQQAHLHDSFFQKVDFLLM
jgi:vacuolar protein sorting-associated protein 11